MTYTFDDAIEELEKLQGSAGYATQGEPEALRFSGLDVNWFLNEATQVIEKLREKYAPTVEMTKVQHSKLISNLENDFTLVETLTEFHAQHGQTINGNTFADLIGDLSNEDIANVWLHPETIKVVDE